MALPAVLLKAKGALKKAGKAKQVVDAAKAANNASDGQLGEATKKIGLAGCGCFVVPLFLLLLIAITVLSSIFGTIQLADGATGGSFGNVNVVPGEAASIQDDDARIKWLYDGNGIPQTEEENQKYLETFEVEYLNSNGQVNKQSLTMHKKLKTEVQAIFQDLMTINFKIEWESGGGSIRGWNTDLGYSGKFYRSAHCYGHAVDINVAANPCAECGVGSESDYKPGVNEYSVTPQVVEIWKKHGFYWGGDWNSLKDYMHFSYFNH